MSFRAEATDKEKQSVMKRLLGGRVPSKTAEAGLFYAAAEKASR